MNTYTRLTPSPGHPTTSTLNSCIIHTATTTYCADDVDDDDDNVDDDL